MNNINFEEDQTSSLSKIDDAGDLSSQVVKLKKLEDELAEVEAHVKELKKQIDMVGGEVIPTMMQEMNISTMKISLICLHFLNLMICLYLMKQKFSKLD